VGASVPLVDVEQIRVSAEHAAYARLAREDLGSQLAHVPQNGSAKRRELLANALLLTQTMAPDAYDAAREAASALGVDDTIELFQSSDRGVDAVRLALYGSPIGIEFIGGYLASLDRGGLLAVIGHEIGHCLAHSGHPKFAWAIAAAQAANTSARRAYAMAAELTADRFGLLACRDLETVLRLEMQMVAGRAAPSLRFDTDAYLTQCRLVAEEIIASGGMMVGNTHPEHYVRGYAEWLFSETDVYRAITGVGHGSRSIEEVEGILQRLLGIRSRPEPVPGVTLERPMPPPTVPAAEVSRRPEDQGRRATAPKPPEGLSADILTDGARRKLAATGTALAAVADAVAPSVRRFAEAAIRRLGGDAADEEAVKHDETTDVLDEERRELLARFEELERRANEK